MPPRGRGPIRPPAPKPTPKPVSKPTLDPVEAARLRNAQAAAAKVAPRPTFGAAAKTPPIGGLTSAPPYVSNRGTTVGIPSRNPVPFGLPGSYDPNAGVGAGLVLQMSQGLPGLVSPAVAEEILPQLALPQADAGASLSGGGGGAGGEGGGPATAAVPELVNIKWKPTTFNVGSGNAPSWWAPKIPEDPANAADPRVNFLMTLNSMIPFLSPEDQRNAAAQLYAMDADHFSEYAPGKVQGAVPVTEEIALAAAREGTPAGPQINESYFTSRERARDAINLLSQLREQTVGGNRWQISPAYTLLQQVLGAQEQFGGGGSVGQYGSYADQGRQTRSQKLAEQGALDPLLAQASSAEAGGFGAIAQLLAQPFFSQGRVSPTFQGPGGRILFGRQNQALGF